MSSVWHKKTKRFGTLLSDDSSTWVLVKWDGGTRNVWVKKENLHFVEGDRNG